MGVRRNFSGDKATSTFCYLVQIDAMQMDVNKTLYPFYAPKIMAMYMGVGRGAGKTKALWIFKFDIFLLHF